MTFEQFPSGSLPSSQLDMDGYPSGTMGMYEKAITASSTLIGRYISDFQVCLQNVVPSGAGNIKTGVKNSSNTIIHTFCFFLKQ